MYKFCIQEQENRRSERRKMREKCEQEKQGKRQNQERQNQERAGARTKECDKQDNKGVCVRHNSKD